MAIDHLVFDSSSAGTIADSHSVGAFVRSDDGTLITHHTISGSQHLDVYSALADGAGTALTSTLIGGKQSLDVNVVEGLNVEIDINGIYDLSTNPTPDHVGIIAHTRAVSIGAAQQVERTSAGLVGTIASGSLANIKALDVNSFMYAIDDVDGGAELLSKDNTSHGLNVHLAGSDITLSVSDAALGNVAIMAKTNTLDVAATAEAVIAAPLANRKYLWIYNNFNKKIFIGQAGVTIADGFPISPGSYAELRAGAAVAVNFVGQAGDLPEIRTLELS